jgi:hypothetical protein
MLQRDPSMHRHVWGGEDRTVSETGSGRPQDL